MKEDKYKFDKLTPVDNINLDVYEAAIDFVFDNSDVKNVAISGAYSAGKSSVLASYKIKHSDLCFRHISLAHFQSPDQEGSSEVQESVLEGKILNQLIHQIPAEKIPQTNFRVKKKVSLKDIVIRTTEIVLLLILVIYYKCFDEWKCFVKHLPSGKVRYILSLSTHQYALILSGFIFIILISLVIYKLISIQKNRNIFRKFNLQGNEIEIFEESEDSYFDKYLNEVLYLFENANADVIVFEDMDRFNANKIFERLREVNTLANIELQKKGKKALRFFYLLRDDIFVSKDRTKFFDYIIPVVPVMDSSNSYDQFVSHLKKDGVYEQFDESFLQGLSLYIDDMRLLKNICNEFIVYYNRLNVTELDCNKMLSIITYKNLFPRDFADLQLNRGFVYTLFNKKDEFINNEKSEIETKIEEKKKFISSAKHEHLKSVQEVNIVFAQKYFSDWRWHDYDSNQLQNFVSQHLTDRHLSEYSARKQALEASLNLGISELSDEISFLEQELLLVKNRKLYQIITRHNIDTIFSIESTNEIGKITDFNDVKSSEYFDLLKYLIRNGYIDETYADYMTYFYENSISRTDKIFLRSITDKKAKEYTYRLKNPQLVVSRLRLADFDQEEVLNFDLLTYLLHSKCHIEYIERMIDQLKSSKNFKFIGAYLSTKSEEPAFVKHLNQRWPKMLQTACKGQYLTEGLIHDYSFYSIYYSSDDVLESVNDDNFLCNYISNKKNYLSIDNPDIDKLIYGFQILGVSFKWFNYDKANKELFNSVYKESLYEINSENIQLIQREILGIKNTEDILHKNYTLMCLNDQSEIAQYINENINEYLSVVLQMSCERICDDENVVMAVLNNADLNAELKHSYISILQTNITSINEVADSSLWAKLLDADIVQYSERNIIDCFNTLKLSESTISYINRCNIELDFSRVECDEETKEALFVAVSICASIENIKYTQILVSLHFVYNNFHAEGLSDDKIAILINNKIIKMTTANLEFVRENYPEQLFNFVCKNIEEYLDIMTEDLFSKAELFEILDWSIDDEYKLTLLKFCDDRISIVGKHFSPDVCLYILDNNFMKTDLSDLFLSFEQWHSSIQARILGYAINDIENIIDNPKPISQKLKDNLLHSDKLTRDTKIDLLIAMMADLSETQIKEILFLLNLSDYLKIFDTRSRPRFEITDESTKLLAAFKKKHLIDNYEENPEKVGYYKIIRPKSASKSLPSESI